ncbi:unnamed protein product [Brugia timori]|uniref:THAP-type domain-containing protein n=1 Tax=Brugia timori TaxID=42155 RepID=A0A0R3QNP4_9BILA|nr:unnamed protein product [Brugia timori]
MTLFVAPMTTVWKSGILTLLNGKWSEPGRRTKRQYFETFPMSMIEYRFRTNSQHLNEHFRNTRRVKSKCREISKDSLASTNLLNDSMTSNFEMQQQKQKTANYVMKRYNDASIDYVSYLYLSHDSITKANCCFSNDLKTKSCYVLLNRRLNRDDRSFSCSGKEDCHITNPVQVYGYNNTVGTVSDSVSSNYKVFLGLEVIKADFHENNKKGKEQRH